jgi:hypothetical protein
MSLLWSYSSILFAGKVQRQEELLCDLHVFSSVLCMPYLSNKELFKLNNVTFTMLNRN